MYWVTLRGGVLMGSARRRIKVILNEKTTKGLSENFYEGADCA